MMLIKPRISRGSPPAPVSAFVRATMGERDLSVGIVSLIRTHGSLANGHPHLQMLATDGGFRPDGTFVDLPFHDVALLGEAFRRAVLALFVRRLARYGARNPVALGRLEYRWFCQIGILQCRQPYPYGNVNRPSPSGAG